MKLSLGGYSDVPIQCHDLLPIQLLLFPFPMEVVQVHLRSSSLGDMVDLIHQFLWARLVEAVQFQEVLVLEVEGVEVQELSFLSSGEEVAVLEEFFEQHLQAMVEVGVGMEHQVEVEVAEVVLSTEWQQQLQML